MAFSDVIDKTNTDQCLLAVIEPKHWLAGDIALGSKIYVSERHITCLTFVPGDSGNKYFIGIVDSWGEFGYVGEAFPELMVSDGSVLLRNDKPFGEYGSFSDLLNLYELQGGNIWVGQMLVEIVAGSIQRRTQLVFSGVISEVGDITRDTIELQFTDHTAETAIVPFGEVTRLDFSDAPEEAIGTPIPIVMGDFSEYSGGSFNPVNLQEVGLGNLAGVPTVMTARHLDSFAVGPEYRISDHLIKELDTDAGVTLLEPEEDVPGLVHPDDWALVNSSYAGLEMVWPMRVKIPVRPERVGTTFTTGVNHMLACDGDLDTYVVIDPDPGWTGWSTLVLRAMPQLGAITEVVVCAWVKTGTGFVRLGLEKVATSAYHGLYTDVTFTGSDQICRHTVNLPAGWPSGEWSFENYQASFQLTQDTHYAEIREMWLLVTYVPNRTQRERKPPRQVTGRTLWHTRPKGFRGSGGPPTDKDLWWPTHNPVVLAYAKGEPDDGSGTYTGTPNALIENGADMAHYFVANYMKRPTNQIESGTGIGNFGNARTELGSYHKLAMFIDKKMPSREQYELLCLECHAMPTWNSDGKLGMVPIVERPTNNYRSTVDVFDWMPDEHFLKDSFHCWRSPVDQIATRVFIEFDYCHGTGKFRKTAFATPDATDNGFGDDQIGAGHLKYLADASEKFFGPGREFRLRAYDVRKQGVAKALMYFYADNLRCPRVWFEFECGVHACDLSVGNVMHFGVPLINGMKVPTRCNTYSGYDYWNQFQWYVAGVKRLEDEGDVSRYLVRGFEAVWPQNSDQWTAAADDT